MKRQLLFLIKAFTALGTLFIFAVCNAYEIGMRALPHEDKGYYFTTSDGGSLISEYERNHERLTALALQCLYEANNSEGTLEKMPKDCADYKSIDTELSLFSNELTPSDAPLFKYRDLVSFVRWPDDPIRFIHKGGASAATFGALIKQGCKKFFEDKTKAPSKTGIFNGGLFCVSHFGKLQFLHSMATDFGEPPKQTRHLIWQWANYAFELSTSSTLWDEEYCDYWQNYPNSPEQRDLGEVMLEDSMLDDSPCNSGFNPYYYTNWFRPLFGYEKVDKYWQTWRLGITFNWSCTTLYGGAKLCPAFVDQQTKNRPKKIQSIQMSALGSIIHMIQDSYANGHTERDNSGLEPKVSLGRVIAFRTYLGQDKDKHAISDKWPTFDDVGPSVDPITAVAKLVWLHNQVSQGKSVSNKYNVDSILQRVYGDVKETDETAGPGRLYAE